MATEPKICNWPQCKKERKSSSWGCSYHWFRLPTNLRRELVDQEATAGKNSAGAEKVRADIKLWLDENVPLQH